MSHFKTPYPTAKRRQDAEFTTPKRKFSDSEESTDSDVSGTCTPAASPELTLVAEFDDLMRMMEQCPNVEAESILLDYAEQVHVMMLKFQTTDQECRRLQVELDKKTHEFSDLEGKLIIARKLLDHEKRNTRRAEEERDVLEAQMDKVRDLVFRDGRSQISEDTREKLQFLNSTRRSFEPNNVARSPQLSLIHEVNSTGSLLADLSYSVSEDDLDASALKSGKTWNKHRPSIDQVVQPPVKRRRSANNKVVEISNAEKVTATTTLTVTKDGPITATSVIESVPVEQTQYMATPKNLKSAATQHDTWRASPQKNCAPSLRQHSLHLKTIVMPDTCGPCNKRIRFSRTALKCQDCRAICHPECKNKLPLPCIPSVNTPTQRNMAGVIADYAPFTAPMVPAIIVHCINEIELKGLNELGIYRIPGSERDVKNLRDKFLRGKGAPCLGEIDVHVICGAVKDFLRSLSEPLVTYKLWSEFVAAAEANDDVICKILSKLPQPNRDTLAYIMLHLKRVAEAKACKMPVANLAKVFGPTIVGYSSSEIDATALLPQTRQLIAVMERLINLPADYWSTFVNVDFKTPNLQQTASTDSLLRPTLTRGVLTSFSGGEFKKRKLFKFPMHS